MADGPQVPAPGGGATPAPGSTPPSPPFGATSATQPTANRGHEMAALQGLGVVVMGLERLLPMVGAGSEIGKDVLSAIRSLSKHVPPGSVTPAAMKNQMETMQAKNAQNGQLMAQLRAKQQAAEAQGGAQGGAQGAAPTAAAA